MKFYFRLVSVSPILLGKFSPMADYRLLICSLIHWAHLNVLIGGYMEKSTYQYLVSQKLSTLKLF